MAHDPKNPQDPEQAEHSQGSYSAHVAQHVGIVSVRIGLGEHEGHICKLQCDEDPIEDQPANWLSSCFPTELTDADYYLAEKENAEAN
mmetsp:Transcript_92805/g.233303  ORF Transcript_92805/g.233303 Transcript_92805/m.233303 type:complete len:88 (-) Transcript_92805:151-414(-)